jgi:hypothetical protein
MMFQQPDSIIPNVFNEYVLMRLSLFHQCPDCIDSTGKISDQYLLAMIIVGEFGHYMLTGTLIFDHDNEVIALDAAALKENVLTAPALFGNVEGFGLSPNGDWLGIETEPPLQNGPLTISAISASGARSTHEPIDLLPVLDKNSYRWNAVGWISDHLVLIGIGNTNNPSDPGDLGILDPFAGEWAQSLIDNLPDKDQYQYFHGFSYSPV